MGEACGAATDCEVQLTCVDGDGGMSCGPRRALGESCTTDRDCRLDARCSGGTCQKLPYPAEDCSVVKECAWGRCLTSDAGTRCVAAAGPGVACQIDRDCASGRCVLGVCTAACNP